MAGKGEAATALESLTRAATGWQAGDPDTPELANLKNLVKAV